MDMARLVAAIQVAYGVLAARVLALMSLVMTFVLFLWAMWEPVVLHFAIAGTFGLTIFLPVLWHTRAELGEKREQA